MPETQTPPAIAMAILHFFSRQPDFPELLGDLKEEFHQRVESSNSKDAKRWFWRETFRSAWALTGRELRQTPIRTTLMALLCFFTIGACSGLYAYFLMNKPENLFYDPRQYVFLLMLNVIPSFAVGSIGVRLLPGREWALALTFTIISVCLGLGGIWYLLFVLRVDLSPIAAVLTSVPLLRLGTFYVGCLCMRGWSATSRARRV